jgi:hypothetical protein
MTGMLSRVIIEQKLADLELALVRQEELMQSQRETIRGLRDLITMEYSSSWKSPAMNSSKRIWSEVSPNSNPVAFASFEHNVYAPHQAVSNNASESMTSSNTTTTTNNNNNNNNKPTVEASKKKLKSSVTSSILETEKEQRRISPEMTPSKTTFIPLPPPHKFSTSTNASVATGAAVTATVTSTMSSSLSSKTVRDAAGSFVPVKSARKRRAMEKVTFVCL